MAERRMFAKTIVLSDAFLDLPMSARCLYFTLGMLSDDDGFVNSPRSVMRQCGASDDDMKILIAKKFVLLFDSGVIVIKHWRINNYLQKDRYKETKYLEEKATLSIDENGSYHREETDVYAPMYTQVRLGKDRLDKDRIGENNTFFPKEENKKEESEREKRIAHFAGLLAFADRYGYDRAGTYDLAANEGITREEIDAAREEAKNANSV